MDGVTGKIKGGHQKRAVFIDLDSHVFFLVLIASIFQDLKIFTQNNLIT